MSIFFVHMKIENFCNMLNYFFFKGKHRKLIQAEETDMEEAHTIASHSTTNQATQNQRDIEAGRKRN